MRLLCKLSTGPINDVWTERNLNVEAAAPPAPQAAPGTLTGYVFAAQETLHFDYTGTDSHIHELWFVGQSWQHNDLSLDTGAPPAISAPSGYLFAVQGTQHVVYDSADHHVIELWWTE